ncbi:MAG: bacillithiol biosynthesis cysteine-adding enzyme BshC, partial [Cytophagales bacterium]|nr:bacillithiol biosynthesis cysteine-adding enzyme BshC [Cytophagales bacterium]
MHVEHIPLKGIGQFSGLFLDYLQQKEALRPFYQAYPTIANFKELLEARAFPAEKREALRNVLREQYAAYPPLVHTQIDSLRRENTFTVTTGHQLNIFGGPLFLVYKLVTVINLAKRLKEAYPGYHFVPVYWMATEDHDFEEISYFRLLGQKYTWQTEQTGAVGRMNPRELERVFGQLAHKLPTFEKAYLEHDTLAAATRSWVHELFGDQGLLCLDADAPALKAHFRDVIREDVFRQRTFGEVNRTVADLGARGYKTQVNPREINFFYLHGRLRERILPQGDGFAVLNTEVSFTAAEMEDLIGRHPERFSPNVMLRPVYQETILPNLAYVGGPAEVAYWLQLKGIFEASRVPFPALMPRNFALVIDKNTARKLSSLCLPVQDYFLDETHLKRNYVACSVADPVGVDDEKALLVQAFAALRDKAVGLDQTLDGFVGAQRQRVLHILDHVEKRLKRAEEKNQAVGIAKLLSVKNSLFPGNGLQERTDSFLNFYLHDPLFLE